MEWCKCKQDVLAHTVIEFEMSPDKRDVQNTIKVNMTETYFK